jgi:hypothetical protein
MCRLSDEVSMNSVILRAVFLPIALVAPLIWAADEPDKTLATDDGYRVPVEKHRKVRLGGIMAGASYSHFSGLYYPYFHPARWGYWGLYDPYWYSPFLSPVLYNGWARGIDTGAVKLNTTAKDSMVYIDGAFAGTSEKLKKFDLEPGAYNVELRAGNDVIYKQRIYVLSGKTVELDIRERKP